jgi:hypothetical protein
VRVAEVVVPQVVPGETGQDVLVLVHLVEDVDSVGISAARLDRRYGQASVQRTCTAEIDL